MRLLYFEMEISTIDEVLIALNNISELVEKIKEEDRTNVEPLFLKVELEPMFDPEDEIDETTEQEI